MSFLEPTVSFSSNFASLFSVMRYNSSVLFHLNLYINLYKRGPSKCKFPDSWLLAWKVTKFLTSFFLPRVSFPLKFPSSFIVMTHNFYEIFYLKHYILLTGRAHHGTNFQTVSVLIKVRPIPYVIFETTTSGFIQTLHHCLVSSKITPLYFLAQTLCTLDKNSPSNDIFDFWVVGWKFTKFLMSYLKLQFSFPLNFATLFSLMRDNSSVLFYLKFYIILTRSPSKCQNSYFRFHQICTFIGSFCWKYKNFQLKKVQRSYVSFYIEKNAT